MTRVYGYGYSLAKRRKPAQSQPAPIDPDSLFITGDLVLIAGDPVIMR